MVTQYDKSVLIEEHLSKQSEFDVIPLQSIIESSWNTLIVYNEKEKKQAWNKETLIAMREFERSV